MIIINRPPPDGDGMGRILCPSYLLRWSLFYGWVILPDVLLTQVLTQGQSLQGFSHGGVHLCSMQCLQLVDQFVMPEPLAIAITAAAIGAYELETK